MAVTEADEESRAGSSSVGREGGASNSTVEVASACNSFCVVEGKEAGAAGADGDSGFRQQAGVEQCSLSQPVQQQLVLGPCTPVRADEANAPCQVRANPARSTTAMLISRDVIFSDWSL